MVDYYLNHRSSILRQITIFLAMLIAAAWSVIPSNAMADDGLRIGSAEWDKEERTL